MAAVDTLPRFCLQDVNAAKESLDTRGLAYFPSAVANLEEFSKLSKQLIGSPYSYEGGTFGKKGRAVLSKDVYEASNVPKHVYLPPHNDMTYRKSWPALIMLGTTKVAESGGHTPIFDCVEALAKLTPEVRHKLQTLGVRTTWTVPQFPNKDMESDPGPFATPTGWLNFFGTDDESEVIEVLEERGTSFWEMKDGPADLGKVVYQHYNSPGTEKHALTGKETLFASPLVFHYAAREWWARKFGGPNSHEDFVSLRKRTHLAGRPDPQFIIVTYGNGSEMPEADVIDICEAVNDSKVDWPWKEGDCVILDNQLWAHAREPYTGSRSVMTAFGDR